MRTFRVPDTRSILLALRPDLGNDPEELARTVARIEKEADEYVRREMGKYTTAEASTDSDTKPAATGAVLD
jgi:hypothetical protein